MLTGQTLTGATHAVYSFLENDLGVDFFIDGNRVPDRESLGLNRCETAVVPVRGLFYHHTWKQSHVNSWRLWGFDGWKTAIDWMRRKRFNLLPMMHDAGGYMWGDVIFQAFRGIPQNENTLAHFVVDPAWRRELNKRIFAYARSSGLQIAYNLFYSQVPEFFLDYYPDIQCHDMNMKNVGINADQPECRRIMRRYWKVVIDTYGIDNSHVYLVCAYRHERLLLEGFKNKNSMTITALEILKEIDPQATMYIETWCWKYRNDKVKSRRTLDAGRWTLDAGRESDSGMARLAPLFASCNSELCCSAVERLSPAGFDRRHPQRSDGSIESPEWLAGTRQLLREKVDSSVTMFAAFHEACYKRYVTCTGERLAATESSATVRRFRRPPQLR